MHILEFVLCQTLVRRRFMEFFFYISFSAKLRSWFSGKWSTLLTAPCVWTSATPVERLSFTRTHYCTNAPSEHASTSPMTTSIQRSHLLSKWANLHFCLISISLYLISGTTQSAYMHVIFQVCSRKIYLIFSQISEDSQMFWIITFLALCSRKLDFYTLYLSQEQI